MNKAIALKIAKACISLFLIFYILQGVHYLIFTRENKYNPLPKAPTIPLIETTQF